jgi:hypothetical protein
MPQKTRAKKRLEKRTQNAKGASNGVTKAGDVQKEPLALQSRLCPLCDRPLIAGASVDEHHLIPRSQGGKEKYLIHRICHEKIHATFREHELGAVLNTWPLLREHSAMQTFIAWVKKKPATYIGRTKKAARLR